MHPQTISLASSRFTRVRNMVPVCCFPAPFLQTIKYLCSQPPSADASPAWCLFIKEPYVAAGRHVGKGNLARLNAAAMIVEGIGQAASWLLDSYVNKVINEALSQSNKVEQ